MNPLIKASGAEENNPNRVILSARSLTLFVFLSGCLPTIGQDDDFAVMDETVIIASRAEELSSQTAGSSAAITSEDILAFVAPQACSIFFVFIVCIGQTFCLPYSFLK